MRPRVCDLFRLLKAERCLSPSLSPGISLAAVAISSTAALAAITGLAWIVLTVLPDKKKEEV